MPDYIPKREADRVTWSTTFTDGVVADPTAVGISVPQATELTTRQTAFVTAYNVANNPLTGSPANVVAKNMAMASFISYARELAGIIQKFPGTSDSQRSALGLTVPDVDPSPRPAPATAPEVTVTSISGHTVAFRLSDPAHPTRRGKPPGVANAVVLTYVGETAPDAAGAWKWEGTTSRTQTAVTFPATVPEGAKVFITALWQNSKGESGPACAPVAAHLQIGGNMSLAA